MTMPWRHPCRRLEHAAVRPSLAVVLACAMPCAMLAPRRSAAQTAQDYTIPEQPAFTYLSASPTKISRPTTARDLVAGLVDGIDSTGRVSRGVALDFTPWVITPYRMTNAQYRADRLKFVFANLQLSLGSVQPAGDTASTDLAIGAKTNLANHADPLLDVDLGRRIDSVVTECQKLKDPTGRPLGPAIEDCADRAVGKLSSEWLNAEGHWNDFALGVAGAFGARLASSELDRSRGRGGALWLTMSVPLGERAGQLLLQGRSDWLRGGGGARDTTSFAGGARLSFGSGSLTGFGELDRSWRRRGPAKTSRSYSVGVELRAAEDLWLSTGMGSAYDTLKKADRTVLIGGLRWGMSSAPRVVTR